MALAQRQVFWASILAFTILNIVENFIHYSIGRENNRNTFTFHFEKPSAHDVLKIVFIMCIFAVLQGMLVVLFDRLV
jgi:uncharacterized membrane protein YhaH (DUF805 family)